MYELSVNGEYSSVCDEQSFVSLLCLEGSAEIECADEKLTMKKGESIFIPANKGRQSRQKSLRGAFQSR